MTRALSIRSWLEPFPNAEGVAVVCDIFRCSTTIHCLIEAQQGPLYVAPSLSQAAPDERVRSMRVFSELSQPVDCRERFDNSPFEALHRPWQPGLASLVATTTGTPAMFAARNFAKVYVGSLVNFSALVTALCQLECAITLIPATLPEAAHVEDEIACQAIATALEGFANLPEFVRECAETARNRILASPRPAALAAKIPTGAADVKIALDLDRSSEVLVLHFPQNPSDILAEVRKVSGCNIG